MIGVEPKGVGERKEQLLRGWTHGCPNRPEEEGQECDAKRHALQEVQHGAVERRLPCMQHAGRADDQDRAQDLRMWRAAGLGRMCISSL
jgi:hypothetical protein